jgi:hypothetical protein
LLDLHKHVSLSMIDIALFCFLLPSNSSWFMIVPTKGKECNDPYILCFESTF